MRHDLLNDARRLADSITPVDAILVVGDIAARGREDEYELAQTFLEELCEIVSCPYQRIFCVPGNHDVDRSAHGPVNSSLRHVLRTARPGQVHDQLEEYFAEPAASAALHEPFENFNRFARPLNCEVSASAPVPPPWDLPFDGTTLRIHGVNSALVCDATDSDRDDARKVILGMNQLAGSQRDHDVVSLVMCHHPLAWLRDAAFVEPLLRRPQLLLTGHVHELGIEAAPDKLGLTIASGAVNPDAGYPGWHPSYNVIELEGEADELVVSVRVRIYGQRARFAPEESRPDPDRYRIMLAPSVTARAEVEVPARVSEPAPRIELPAPARTGEREMIFDVMRADKDARRRAAVRLNLIDPAFVLATDGDESRLAFIVRQTGKLSEMHEAVRRESARG